MFSVHDGSETSTNCFHNVYLNSEQFTWQVKKKCFMHVSRAVIVNLNLEINYLK